MNVLLLIIQPRWSTAKIRLDALWWCHFVSSFFGWFLSLFKPRLTYLINHNVRGRTPRRLRCSFGFMHLFNPLPLVSSLLWLHASDNTGDRRANNSINSLGCQHWVPSCYLNERFDFLFISPTETYAQHVAFTSLLTINTYYCTYILIACIKVHYNHCSDTCNDKVNKSNYPVETISFTYFSTTYLNKRSFALLLSWLRLLRIQPIARTPISYSWQ